MRCITFGPLRVSFDDRVLEPRPWTLLQSEWAAELDGSTPTGPILELCSGAGQIGQAAAALSGRGLVQVDVDDHACDLARRNAVANGITDRVDVRCADLADGPRVGERFPLVLADPPYLASADVDDWPEDPERAVDGGPSGVVLQRRCVAVAARHLATGGVVLLQTLGESQVRMLEADLDRAGLRCVEVRALDDRRAIARLEAG